MAQESRLIRNLTGNDGETMEEGNGGWVGYDLSGEVKHFIFILFKFTSGWNM